MRPRGFSRHSRPMWGRAKGALLVGVALGALAAAQPAFAQESLGALGGSVSVQEGTQLFLEADTVSYDSETSTVTASGGVQIDYGDYQLVARNIVYDQATRRLVAAGDVELIEPSGNRIYADAVDITDDFADGFVEALRIETPDNTRFASAQAARRDGAVMTLERGVYTACEACAEHPERAPLWQVKARRIVWDQEAQVVRYYGARFELFGAPIAYLPYFASPDPTVERRSGFLAPEFRGSSDTGTGIRIPYFWAIADDKDVTVAGTYYTKQGFLAEAEYRQAFESGYFTLKAAGIAQRDPEDFDDYFFDSVNPPVLDTPSDNRGMIGSQAQFAINERWTFGWDALAQTDSNFSNVYEIEGFSDVYRASEIYLTGLGDRSFFDLRAQRFEAQTENTFSDDIQPYVLPSLDYEYISESPILGGEVELDINVTNIRRDDSSPAMLLVCQSAFLNNGICEGGSIEDRFRTDVFRRTALEGDYARATAEAQWRTSTVTDFGLVLTPTLTGRGDLHRADMSSPGFPFDTATLGGIEVDETGGRAMATAAIEARYPWLIETAGTSHVIEPIGQLIVRPDEMEAGILPNEDAQSLVFNTTNLFSLDKFSGYDRMEGGTRANVGVKYAGVLGAGYFLDAVAGQSFHLGGENPYAVADLALLGYDSGLETDRSDYVSSLALTTPIGLVFGAQGRFDEEDLSLRRADLSAAYGTDNLSGSLTYSNIAEQPVYGFAEDRQQVTASASLRLSETLSTFGSLSYDIENESVISRSFGVGYADECFSLIAQYESTSDRYQLQSAESRVMFRLSLRTLVETEYSYDLGDDG
ncbi:LPS-assembly protein LptD [Aureimonas populi]|uniref:LPS-assembly protein LptD n=1 Tax=Aureimonas populi TaxID=1701758 RepID=A0ABW5CJ86_9HYPH|nr:LPS-assembly protein LptD [Aureimonas populi]